MQHEVLVADGSHLAQYNLLNGATSYIWPGVGAISAIAASTHAKYVRRQLVAS